MKSFLQFPLFFLLLWSLFSSCVKQQEVIYFQNPQIKNKYGRNQTLPVEPKRQTVVNYSAEFQKDDLISISVSAIDPDVVKPFNLSLNTQAGQKNDPSNTAPTYLIDGDGMIDFPVLGKIHLAGLNRMQATEAIRERIKSYVNNPIINIRILNFKITVLGEVLRPGVYSINNERITVLEAIGLAGDLTIQGLRKNVLVVRDVDGVKKEMRIDLTSKEVFYSPAYYLCQNDLVYVEPSKHKIRNSSQPAVYGSLAVSSMALFVNLINLLKR
ncbi:MAG: polysaccharide biosynthesis/export family protein [Chitinophagaceae bacterium]|nr:polysaccharide biosynthesis/export family protein [Chitinophagaceae bacterium]